MIKTIYSEIISVFTNIRIIHILYGVYEQIIAHTNTLSINKF